ncbi:diadenylate cyclase CdaA [bacterium]|nr:diadenylate cyclase CdaA [bacterium]
MDLFQLGFIKVSLIDVLDIFVISFLLYWLYFFIKDSRAAQMLIGLVLILVFSVIVQLFNMRGMSWIFDNLRTIWLVAFVVLFQQELRRVLMYLGQTPLMRVFVKNTPEIAVDELHNACIELAKRRYGALIVMTKDSRLKPIIDTGLRMDAELSRELLISVFNPRSPLHDGAIIIDNNVIQAAKCILPLSQNPDIDPDFGMRHRAALGLSEESDAICIVVSEETGRISIAESGAFYKDLNYDSLRDFLHKRFRLIGLAETVQ